MLHRLKANFLTWPDWIKTLLFVALISLTMTAAVFVTISVIENIW